MRRSQSMRNSAGRYRSGIALAITLVVLVVLSVTTTILAVRVAQVRQRQRYIMDYQKARYGLDSAMKYILAVMPEKTIALADREDAPDFSDLFWLTREQYLNYISAWIETTEPEQLEKYLKPAEETEEEISEDAASLFAKLIAKMMGKDEQTDPNSLNHDESAEEVTYVDPEQIVVPGPYGPPWPNVIEPIELNIGDSRITITIEDENAKMPLSWAVTSNINVNKQARAAMLNFSELMMMDEQTVENLFTELNELGKRKLFQLNPTAVMLTVQTAQPQQGQTQAQTRQFTTSRTQRRTATQPAVQPPQQTQQQARPAVGHAADFAKLFHSSLLDLETLSVPLPDKAFDDESPMKYLALWGSQRINVNTAPRQVLEAAFTFGGSPEEIAEKIIRLRREKPFKTIADLRDQMFGDLNAIDRAAPYIDVKSNFFSIRITSRCGSARTSAVAAVIKEGKQMERLIILYGR
ncbi:MAG TPA: type II secretion system protein GspK [Anaerohalosphaeraceae bacterium]|nr:type II secretion system protein GspK [Anaerohalosphaeraceae bacterium]